VQAWLEWIDSWYTLQFFFQTSLGCVCAQHWALRATSTTVLSGCFSRAHRSPYDNLSWPVGLTLYTAVLQPLPSVQCCVCVCADTSSGRYSSGKRYSDEDQYGGDRKRRPGTALFLLGTDAVAVLSFVVSAKRMKWTVEIFFSSDVCLSVCCGPVSQTSVGVKC